MLAFFVLWSVGFEGDSRGSLRPFEKRLFASQIRRYLASKYRACPNPFSELYSLYLFRYNGIANDTSVGRTERVGLMSEQNQNLASDHSKKYTYRSEPKQISFRVSESEFAKLKQSAEALQMSVPAFVKAKAQNARLVTPKVAPDIAQAIARDLAKAGGNINQIAKWCNTHQHDVAPGDAQRLSENLKIMQKELQKIWQQLK